MQTIALHIVDMIASSDDMQFAYRRYHIDDMQCMQCNILHDLTTLPSKAYLFMFRYFAFTFR